MKKVFFLVVFALGLILTLKAQQPERGRGDPTQRAEQQTNTMAENLSFSEAQTNKVRAINLKYAQKGQAAREQAEGDWEAARAAMQQLRKEQDAELQTVMTTEQWESWLKIRETQRANFKKEKQE